MTALELADRLASGWPALEDVNAAVVELRRLAELERDAARYRWLRDTSNPDDPSHPIALHINEICQDASLSGIDAAIDAAMGEAK